MSFFRRKTDKHKASPLKAADGARSSRPPSIASSNSSISADFLASDINGGFEDIGVVSGAKRPRSLLLRSDAVLDAANGENGFPGNALKPQTPMGTSSRLSKTLQEVLHDKDALAYFIQYMASRDAEHIIKFWLDAESFQASSWTRIRTHSLNKIGQNSQSKSPSPEKSPLSSDNDANTHSTASPRHTGQFPENKDHVQDSPSTSSNQKSAIHRTGTAEANLNILSSSSTATSPTSCDPQLTLDCDLVADVCAGNSADTDPRFSEAGAHGTDPLSRGSLRALREEGTCLSRDSGLGNSSSHLEATSNSSLTKTSSADVQHSKSGVVTLSGSSSPGHHGCDGTEGADNVTTATTCTTTTKATTTAQQSPLLDTTKESSFQEKLRKSIEKDAVSIYSKYISLDATHPIGITDKLRNETISAICREDGQVDPQCFMACQEFVVALMDKENFLEFLQSDFHCKHQIDILTASQVHLADVLYNEVALFYFMEFMEQEGAIDLLQCWLAIDNFQQQLSSQHGHYDATEAQNDAMVIYEKYFSLQATHPLGFEDKVRFEVECNICREEGPLPDCFVTAKRQVLRTIDKVYFPQFLTSDLYFKFMGELINAIHSAQDLTTYKRKRAGSDASSEHSVGSRSVEGETTGATRNTLLAIDSRPLNIKKALNKIGDDMRIDNSLLNPEALWMRPQAGKMSLGRINEVGQFISEFELDPDTEKKKKPGTPFFKKKKDKEKTQEEMALQIAQMIISDVNSATAGEFDESLLTPKS